MDAISTTSTDLPNAVQTQRELAKPNPPIAHAGSSFNWQKESLQPYNTLGYTPCSCEGACDEDCACVFQSSYCDEYCNCPPSCAYDPDQGVGPLV